jgi:hypothetical protein
MKRSARYLGLSITAFAIALSCSPAGAGEWDLDLRGGWYAKEVEGPFIGIGGLTHLGSGSWYLNPNLEFAFGDDFDFITLNGDVHYDFDTEGDVTFWAGGGLALVHVNPSGSSDSETDLGLNALLGLGKRTGTVRPFGQIKLLLSDETEFVIAGGVRF